MNNYDDSSSGIGVGSVIGNKFRLEEKLGQGSFDTLEVFAIKLEKRNQRHSSMLVREIKVMMELKNEFGYARMITYGKDEDYNFVVMTNLGKNLDSILKKCGQRFTLATCMNIAEQMITRIEFLHNHNLIHRDIKPENFVIGSDRSYNQIYLIDFGLAKYYKDSEGNHIPIVEKKGMIGTARYASVNAHQGQEQSRRDDLEALGYVLLYFIRGKLPWQQIYAETKDEKYEKIKNMKMNQPLEQICEGCPNELVQYLRIVKKLEFTEQPNYTQLKALFRKVITDKKIENTAQCVDWENLPEYRHRKKMNTQNDLPQIPTQREIQLKQQQIKQQQILLQQQQIQLQQQQQQQPLGITGNIDIKKNNIIQNNGNQIGQQSDQKIQKLHVINTANNKQNISEQEKQIEINNIGNNINNNTAAVYEFSKSNSNQNNIHVSPPITGLKQTSLQNGVVSPDETGKFGADSKSNAIKDSDDKLNNEKQSKNLGSTMININNQNTSTQGVSVQQITNREVSVSIINNHPGFQNNSQLNCVSGNHHGNSPRSNPQSSSNIQPHQEKGNSFLHAVNHLHSNSNLLNVPTKDQVTFSATSLTGTSRINNYTGSESDTILDEGGIQISTMMIDKNACPLSTSEIRKDIRTRSLIFQQSQLEFGEVDINRIFDHQTNSSKQGYKLQSNLLNSVIKFDSNHAVIDLYNENNLAHLMKNDSADLNKQMNNNKKQQNENPQQENQYLAKPQQASANNKSGNQNGGSYKQYASAEEIKEHQDEENNSNTRNIKNYKTQFTPITEVKESTYKSFKTKASRTSCIGENLTETIYEYPIMINVLPIKKAFQKKH